MIWDVVHGQWDDKYSLDDALKAVPITAITGEGREREEVKIQGLRPPGSGLCKSSCLIVRKYNDKSNAASSDC